MSTGGGSAPQPQPFIPVNIGTTANLAQKYDELGWSFSDQDLLSRFPGLVATRDANAVDAAQQITGPLDPNVQNKFTTDALAQAFNSFGGGNSAPSIGTAGSAARGGIASSIDSSVAAKQASDQSYLQQQLLDNPPRSIGIGGKEVTDIAISNALGANNAAYGSYAAGVSTSNADAARQAQQTQAAISAAISIIGIAAAASDIRAKENIIYVGESPMGLPIVEFSYRAGCVPRGLRDIRWRGTLADEVEAIKPEAVTIDPHTGFKIVNYSMNDLKMEEAV